MILINEYDLHVDVENKIHVVNLVAKSFTCREFDLKKFLCKYALAAAKFKGIL